MSTLHFAVRGSQVISSNVDGACTVDDVGIAALSYVCGWLKELLAIDMPEIKDVASLVHHTRMHMKLRDVAWLVLTVRAYLWGKTAGTPTATNWQLQNMCHVWPFHSITADAKKTKFWTVKWHYMAKQVGDALGAWNNETGFMDTDNGNSLALSWTILVLFHRKIEQYLARVAEQWKEVDSVAPWSFQAESELADPTIRALAVQTHLEELRTSSGTFDTALPSVAAPRSTLRPSRHTSSLPQTRSTIVASAAPSRARNIRSRKVYRSESSVHGPASRVNPAVVPPPNGEAAADAQEKPSTPKPSVEPEAEHEAASDAQEKSYTQERVAEPEAKRGGDSASMDEPEVNKALSVSDESDEVAGATRGRSPSSDTPSHMHTEKAQTPSQLPVSRTRVRTSRVRRATSHSRADGTRVRPGQMPEVVSQLYKAPPRVVKSQTFQLKDLSSLAESGLFRPDL